MKVRKVLNNNIVLAIDNQGMEKMLLGKGIGFGRKAGEEIDSANADKVFILETKEASNKLIKMVGEVPGNQLELTRLIIEQAQKELDCIFDDSIYIALLDHINYALTRFRNNEQIQNALFWEVKKFYPREFKAALQSLQLIKYHEKAVLNEDEASFIAMHFVNGQQGGTAIKDTVAATTIIQDILSIIKFHYKINLDEESISYSRFITHIRFFLQRLHQKHLSEESDGFLFEQVKKKYPETYKCVLRIQKYLLQKLNVEIGYEEMLYFMLHIHRLTERELNTKH